MVDLDFNFIKSIGQLNTPSGVCFKNQRLYVADNLNKRVQILSEDLELIKSLPLEYHPWKLKVSNEMLCITSDSSEYPATYFYNLSN